ncbi:MAG: C40 family peptidase [Nocardiopsaceae bacterium]|jgi:cell wall-associated NlpC family hydrolase|nr:C40 family peptidase [Nocardiopsaceae bacterium]
MAAGPTAAQPQPTIKQVRHKIDELSSQQDHLGQRLDQVTLQLGSARKRLKKVTHRVDHTRSRFRTMRTEIGQMAAYAYEGGSMTSPVALLTSDDPQRVLSQASMLMHLTDSQHQRMDTFITAARKLSGAQRDLQRTENGVATLQKQVKGQRVALAKVIKKQKATLATLTARQRRLARAASVGGGGTTTATPPPPPATTTTTAAKASPSAAQQAVAYAYAQLGKPYVWGATGPSSFDCSGLVMAAWSSAGVSIPRDTYSQWAALPHVPMSSIKPGDLIFFEAEGHVAIYVGNNMIIDAPQPGQSVEKVGLSSPWYSTNVDGAARP